MEDMKISAVIEEAIKLFADLLFVQRSYSEKIKAPWIFFTKDEIKRHENNGETFLNISTIPLFDIGICSELKEEICSLIKKYRPELALRIEEVNSFLCKNPEIFEEFYTSKEIFKEAPERELLGFIVYHTMRPIFQKYAEAVKNFSRDEGWLRDYCPVCGEKANLSYLRREDGKRVLICPLCSTEWIYRYLACSWCGNDDHRDIKYFEVAEFPAYEVYLCDKCLGYLKTFNEKKGFGHEDWMIEDIKTLPLDLLALKKGYNRSVQGLLLQ